MNLLNEFYFDMEVQHMKFMVGKQMFCPITNQVLDYRTATFVEPKVGATAVYSSLVTPDKWDEIRTKIEESGVEVERIYNLDSLKQLKG